MKKIFLLLAFLYSVSLHAQTDDQIVEWVQRGQAAEEAGHYKDAIHYLELVRDGYGARFGRNDDTYLSIMEDNLSALKKALN